MRVGRNSGFVKDENGKVLGITLGADFTAEHEWGIDRLKSLFGMKKYEKEDASDAGIGRRMIREMPDKVRLYDCKDCAFFTNASFWKEPPTSFKEFQKSFGLYDGENDVITAWSESDFGILVKGKQNKNDLREIVEAFHAKNMAIFLGKSGPFQNGGLVFAIADRVPTESTAKMREVDEDSSKLWKAANKTGIYKVLEKAKKGFFACSPKWIEGFRPQGETPESKHPVIFWLNPEQQDRNNHGWFTVEQLEAWTRGEGPVPIRGKNAN